MRALVVIALLAVALWRAAADWEATIGEGYAYRMSSIGDTIAEHQPQAYARLVGSIERSGVPYAWDPVGAVIMSIPLALLFAALAGLLWITRPRREARRR
jgi:hypothetical protein